MISYFYVGCCKVLLFKTLRLTKLNKLLLTYLLTYLTMVSREYYYYYYYNWTS